MQSTMERGVVESEQFDLETRRYYDTVTWLAETLPGSMRTPFEYRFDGRELYASDGGALEPIFDKAIQDARSLPVYEQRRREIEKREYQEMIAMMKSDQVNTIVVVSDFPPELMNATRDVGGYNVARKQTMLRVLTRTPEGMLKMYSQSLDGSNRRALETIYEYFGRQAAPGELLDQRIHQDLRSQEQEILIDSLMKVYDRSLQAQYGGEWYAGQLNGRRINTYDFVCQQQYLINSYLATTERFTGGMRDYNLAAAIEARFLKRSTVKVTNLVQWGIAAHAMALAEMKNAGNIARAEGRTYSGCGTTARGEQNNLSANEQLEDSGIGNQADKKGNLPDDKYGSRYFKCPKGHQNVRREKNRLISRCQHHGCSAKVSCK